MWPLLIFFIQIPETASYNLDNEPNLWQNFGEFSIFVEIVFLPVSFSAYLLFRREFRRVHNRWLRIILFSLFICSSILNLEIFGYSVAIFFHKILSKKYCIKNIAFEILGGRWFWIGWTCTYFWTYRLKHWVLCSARLVKMTESRWPNKDDRIEKTVNVTKKNFSCCQL